MKRRLAFSTQMSTRPTAFGPMDICNLRIIEEFRAGYELLSVNSYENARIKAFLAAAKKAGLVVGDMLESVAFSYNLTDVEPLVSWEVLAVEKDSNRSKFLTSDEKESAIAYLISRRKDLKK